MRPIYIFLLSIILFSLPHYSMAQVEPYSKVLWDAEENGIQAYASCQTFELETVIIGETFNNKGFAMKVDNNGDPIWTKTFVQEANSHSPRLLNIINTIDSCQLILGHIFNESNDNLDAFLVKIDKNGEFLWTKTNSLGGLVNLNETVDSGFILIGEHDFSSSVYRQLSIVKITKNGSLEWSRVIRFGTALSKGLSVVQNENGNYIITGYYKGENETKTTALLAELSNTGEINWSYGYNNLNVGYHYEIEDLLILNNEYYLLMNNGMNSVLLKTDTLGSVLNAKEINGSAYYDMGYGIKRKLHKNNQDELLFIHSNSFGGYIKTDLNGEAIINGNLFLPVMDIQFKEQNELLAIGNGPLMNVKSVNYPTDETIGLIQMDNEGNGIECIDGTFDGYAEYFELQQLETEYIIEGGGISTNLPIEIGVVNMSQRDGCVDFAGVTTSLVNHLTNDLTSIYPNPSQGWINFNMKETIDGKLYIISPLGQVIHQEPINQQQIKIDLNRFGNGVYLYKIESDKALISSGRFILNK